MRHTILTLLILASGLWAGVVFGQTPVQANFSSSASSGCTSPITVSFTDQSTGNPTNWWWSFGDGTSSTVQNPTHAYQQPGTYWVTLSVWNGTFGDSTSMWLTIGGPQIFGISPSQTLTCGPGPVEFLGFVDTILNVGLTWQWDISGPLTLSSTDSAFQTNLSLPGTYQVQLIVNDGTCADTMVSSLIVPQGITIGSTVVDETCSGANGSITVNATGGTAPYVYTWFNGMSTPTISNLSAGDYVVAVADANGCTTLDTITVANNGLDIAATVQDPSCDNSIDGYIAIDVLSGLAPYAYQWSNGATTDSIGGLTSGVYSVTVTDDLGCTVTESYTLNADPLNLVITTTTTDCNGNNGTAEVAVSGGLAPYTFQWTNGDTDSTTHNLAVGGYAVYVTDYSGCQDHEVLYIEYDDSCTINISGRMYYDINADCVYDPNVDFAIPGWVSLSNGQGMIAGLDGTYDFDVFPGTYSVSYNPSYYTFLTPLCPVNGLHLLTNQMTDTANVDFAFDSDSAYQDLAVYMYKTNIRPGLDHHYYVSVYNNGPLPANGILTWTHDPLVAVSNFSIAPTTFNPSNYTASWVLPTLLPGQGFFLNITGSISPSTPVGTPITTIAQVDPIANDQTPFDNIDTCIRSVTASFDPNDKQVTPEGEGPEGFIGQDEQDMRYRIRFQNTGNDTAFVVVLKDVIEQDLDINSFKPATSSHPYELTIENGNTLVFTFNDIFLVDSATNEPLSHGHVEFLMRHNGTLPYGTEITNDAAIYFDFNAPIITNTALNTIASPTAIQDDLTQFLQVFPNPSQGNFVIQYESLTVEGLMVYDIAGKQAMTQSHHYPGRIELSMNQNPPGTYLVHLQTNRGPVVQKITLLR